MTVLASRSFSGKDAFKLTAGGAAATIAGVLVLVLFSGPGRDPRITAS